MVLAPGPRRGGRLIVVHVPPIRVAYRTAGRPGIFYNWIYIFIMLSYRTGTLEHEDGLQVLSVFSRARGNHRHTPRSAALRKRRRELALY